MALTNGPYWGNAILGQVLSACLTAGNTVSHVLCHAYGLDIAALQVTLMYLAVAAIFWLVLIHFSVEYFWTRKLRAKAVAPFSISLLDTTASLLAVHAVAHVNLPMRTLLSTISTPAVMILSRIFLGTKYRLLSVLGAALAIGGVISASASQFPPTSVEEASGAPPGGNVLLGYGMCLLSAVLYGISNVYTEQVTKSGGSLLEYLALSSTFSAVWSAIYLFGFRTRELSSLKILLTSTAGIYLCFYCCSLALFYSLLPVVMLRSSAALFNISLLTVNFYSLMAGYWLFGDVISWPFFISFSMVMLGLILFNTQGPLPVEYGGEQKSGL